MRHLVKHLQTGKQVSANMATAMKSYSPLKRFHRIHTGVGIERLWLSVGFICIYAVYECTSDSALSQ